MLAEFIIVGMVLLFIVLYIVVYIIQETTGIKLLNDVKSNGSFWNDCDD